MSKGSENRIVNILKKHSISTSVYNGGENQIDPEVLVSILTSYNESICNVIRDLASLSNDNGAKDLLISVSSLIRKFKPKVESHKLPENMC